jgi:D-sedoheptulose 7-phosphate isomerase
MMDKELRIVSEKIIACYRGGGKVLAFGNGGSAASSQHFVGELVSRFKTDRKPLPALSLVSNVSVLTAIANDYGFEKCFSRQVEAFARKGDAAIGLTTSGNSENVIEGIRKAREMGCFTVVLTGKSGGKISGVADMTLKFPSDSTPEIQEMSDNFLHKLAGLVESGLFD